MQCRRALRARSWLPHRHIDRIVPRNALSDSRALASYSSLPVTYSLIRFCTAASARVVASAWAAAGRVILASQARRSPRPRTLQSPSSNARQVGDLGSQLRVRARARAEMRAGRLARGGAARAAPPPRPMQVAVAASSRGQAARRINVDSFERISCSLWPPPRARARVLCACAAPGPEGEAGSRRPSAAGDAASSAAAVSEDVLAKLRQFEEENLRLKQQLQQQARLARAPHQPTHCVAIRHGETCLLKSSLRTNLAHRIVG